jgi:hypothetical protein
MADNHPFPMSNKDSASPRGVEASTTGRVAELTWALIDERISDQEMATLDRLLSTDENARREYLRCIQLHADLQANFAGRPSPADTSPEPKPSVLGSLGAPLPPLELPATPPHGANS